MESKRTVQGRLDQPGASSHKNRNRILTAVTAVIFLAILILADQGIILDSYGVRIIRLCGVYTIAALSMTLINGLTGQFSLGQAGFMAIGAYTTSLLIIAPDVKEQMYYVTPILGWVRDMHAPFLPAIIIGGLISAAVAFLIGFPVLRLRGDYLAIATLGFSEIIRVLITNLGAITNSSIGIKSIPDTANIWWTTIAAVLCVFLVYKMMKTSFGRAFKSIRDDEVAAEAMGISLFKHKMLSFVISGFLAGRSGGLLASVVGVINPLYFRFTLAYEILLIVVLGGQGSITGTVLSACLITASKEWLRFLDAGFSIGPIQIPEISGLRMLVFSVLLMVVILFYRKGLFGSNEFSWDGLFRLIGRTGRRLKGLFRRGEKGGASK